MPLFDTYMAVDWSAAGVPRTGKDSIWFACATRKGRTMETSLENPSTRLEARDRLRARLADAVTRHRRVLVGFDFGFGYAAGTAEALFGAGAAPPWQRIWSRLRAGLEDGADNVNNRFLVANALNRQVAQDPGPFWGRPRTRSYDAVPATRPPFPLAINGHFLAEYRLCERRLRERRQYVQSMWKLMGAGAVGGQSLAGIPYVQELRYARGLAAHGAVWPFETDFAQRLEPNRRPFLLFAEVWPSLLAVDDSVHTVRDAAQVLTLVGDLADRDGRDELAADLSAPADLSSSQREICVCEEGWILGA